LAKCQAEAARAIRGHEQQLLDEQRAGVIVQIRVFAIETGTLVREKGGDEEEDEP